MIEFSQMYDTFGLRNVQFLKKKKKCINKSNRVMSYNAL